MPVVREYTESRKRPSSPSAIASLTTSHIVAASAYRPTTVSMCDLDATQQRLARHRFAVFPHHPFVGAIVLRPNEAVANDLKLMGTSKGDEAIGGLEVPRVFGGMDALRLHAVLGRENLEVPQNQGHVFRLPQHPMADSDADLEAVADGVLQGPTIRLRPSGCFLLRILPPLSLRPPDEVFDVGAIGVTTVVLSPGECAVRADLG